MLSELRIRNFALIDRLSVRLGPGLNVLTGETGAGKSIIVGALSLLLGERASADVVRAGEDRASVEGVFDVAARDDVARILDERGIDPDEDGVLVLKREVAAAGRNRAWVNGSPTTAAVLGELGRALVDLHGQHEHQTLLKRDEQRAILDAYGGHGDLLSAVREAHREAVRLRRDITELDTRRRDAAQRADFLRFQADEIEAASLKAGEEEEMEDEARRLSHSEELQALSGGLADAVSGSERALLHEVGSLRRQIDSLVRIDPAQEDVRELYDTVYYSLQELGERMERYSATIEHDPRRLEEIRRRQDLVFRLKSKYGQTLDEVMEVGRRARAELDLVESAEWELGGLKKKLAAAEEALAAAADSLSAARGAAMERLSAEVSAVLPELGMSNGAVFRAERVPLAQAGAFGAEEVEFRVSLNRGLEPKALSHVASGGEMSRIMLALKTILARLDSVPTLVFDEVDAGIGGRVGLQVGDKMREVAGTHQVFAITHLPQIASRAHVHLLVRKGERDGRTTTEVTPLESADRVQEIARMLGGDPESAVSLEHARELLERGVGV
ncbi:MAG: DNA repair protein RecN [uncultured Gemmatimonadetes bacterium]|uniref:DNA repair protein RecN n=1 Tax=uncultured Gemmatimonadota bacterium TaxID=203437 RepID=A0A6J4M8V4_9BACT|nr:MAG: DNA repair protein RecN [uncultured Gemmatimonadota bacterium]